MTALGAIAVAVGCLAVAEDITRRRISNWTSGGAALGGVACHLIQQGGRGAILALGGALTGFGIFLVFYLLHGMGAGDLKLMAGFGSVLGPGPILEAAWIAALAGGLMAVTYVGVRAVRRRPSGPSPDQREEAIPYAPAIVAGAWLALLGQG